MSDLTDKLSQAATALQTTSDAINAAIADATSGAPTTADAILSTVVSSLNSEGLVSVFGADTLSTALTAEGYTVTAPVGAGSTEAELPAGDTSSDTAS